MCHSFPALLYFANGFNFWSTDHQPRKRLKKICMEVWVDVTWPVQDDAISCNRVHPCSSGQSWSIRCKSVTIYLVLHTIACCCWMSDRCGHLRWLSIQTLIIWIEWTVLDVCRFLYKVINLVDVWKQRFSNKV